MIAWAQRPLEERRLLNPAFCGQLIWRAARGHFSGDTGPLSFEQAFLVLPLVLNGELRRSLPRDTRTSMAVWLESEPLRRRWVAVGARLLVPFTRDALLFAGIHGFIALEGARVRAVEQGWTKVESKATSNSSDEVEECARRAEFVGKWMAQTGSAPTVFALLGVRP
jgi:Family of unknown function (DUF6521)